MGTIARCFIIPLKPSGLVLCEPSPAIFFIFLAQTCVLRWCARLCACVNWLIYGSLSRTACSGGSPSVPSLLVVVVEEKEVKLFSSCLSKRCSLKGANLTDWCQRLSAVLLSFQQHTI